MDQEPIFIALDLFFWPTSAMIVPLVSFVIVIKIKLEEYIYKKGHCQPFNQKFSLKNNDGVFINLILYGWPDLKNFLPPTPPLIFGQSVHIGTLNCTCSEPALKLSMPCIVPSPY